MSIIRSDSCIIKITQFDSVIADVLSNNVADWEVLLKFIQLKESPRTWAERNDFSPEVPNQ